MLGECKGNATVASRLSDKRILTAEFQVDDLPFTESAETEGFAECDEMLPVHVLCVVYGRRSRKSRSLEESLSLVPQALKMAILSPMLLKMGHFKNSSSIHTTCSLWWSW
jgi:hypothetical protein